MEEGDLGVTMIRKGPWMPEEDEVLVDYVRKYGARDWSAIRSKGLLPRTGKSCRLRWVNKLKPDLKIGCKFSPEEERIVLDLQAQFGNKWARIATYLPGRTDNDVKNFWSTRQKRLARLLRTSLPTRSSQSVKKPNLSSPRQVTAPIPHQVTALPPATINDADPFCEGSSNMIWRNNSFMNFSHESQQMVQMPPFCPGKNENMVNVDTKLPFLEPEAERRAHFSSNASPLELPVSPLPLQVLDLPDFPIEDYDHILGLGGMCYLEDGQQPSEAPSFEYGDSSQHGIKREECDLIDNFFDNLPTDMFDYLEPNDYLDPKED